MTDQNIPFVMHCTGSNVGSALIDGVSKHNARNPDNRILYLNCGALATELTNEQCDFWHFRFAGSVDMRAAARIKSLPADLKKVYLLNQDYLFGQSIQHDTKKWLAKLRPGYRDRARRTDAVRQGAGFLVLCRQDQGVGGAERHHRQLQPRPQFADQGRRSMPASTSATMPSSPI